MALYPHLPEDQHRHLLTCTGYLGHPFGKGLNYKEKIVIVPKKVKEQSSSFSYFEQISQVVSTSTIYV